MKTFDVSCPPRGLVLGYAGENVARGQAFDFTAWAEEYGAGSLQVALQRPGDAAPYPVALTVEGTVATWLPTETDLQEAGTGQLQLIYTVGTVRVKTLIVSVLIGPSLGSSGEVPAPGQAWIDQLTDLAAVTEQNAASAAESAENAETSAEDAQQSATDAVAAKNAAVAAAEAAAASASHYPQIVNGVWYVWSPTAGAYISTGIDAQGEDGVSPTVEITAIQGGHRVVITDAAGPHTFDVMDGVTPDLSAYRTAADQDVIDDAQDDQIDDLKSALNTKAGILRDTASGSVASFTPDATIPNLLGVSVDIEPVQDLHGFDSPWPAGGNINKLDPTVSYSGLTYNPAVGRVFTPTVSTNKWTDNGDGTFGITLGDWAQAGFLVGPLPSGAVYFSFASATGGLRISVFVMDSEYAVNRVSLNRNPITEGAAVEVNTTFSGTDTYLGVYIGGAGQAATISQPYVYTGADASTRTYYPYSNICPISGRDSVTVDANGTTHTIQLGDTVYGGTLDVTNGTLTVDMASVRVADSNIVTGSVSAAGAHRYNISATGIKRAADADILGNLICSSYPNVTALETYRVTLGASVSHNSNSIYIYDPEFATATVAEFTTAKGDVQLVYELATPIVIDLDPVQIATIANQTNNVWTDAGDVSVEFAADLKTYIDSKIAAAVAALS